MRLSNYELVTLACSVLNDIENVDEVPNKIKVHRDFLKGLSSEYLALYGRCVKKKIITRVKKH